jgi:site-specific recombinase XerD
MNNKQVFFNNLNFLTEQKKIIEVFSEDDIKLMFQTLAVSNDYLKTIWGEWMRARDICILAALRYLLLRPLEACAIKFSDINLEKKILHVRGENNKQKKDRVVCVTDNFLRYFNYLLRFPRWMWKNSPYLFPSAENEHISAGRWKMIMRDKILKPAGLYRSGARSYLLRMTGATELLDKSGDPWLVAQTLGHSDLRTVKNYYFQTERFRERQSHFLNDLN